MYQLNNVYCCDCVDGLNHLQDESIDLIITSPPYDKLRDYTGYSFDFERIAQGLNRVITPGGVIVWVVADQTRDFCESLSSFKHAIYFVEKCGLNLETMIWHKGNAPKGYRNNLKYTHSFDYMFVLFKGKPKTFNPIEDIKSRTSGSKHSATKRQKDGSLADGGKYVTKKWTMRHNVWEFNVGAYAKTGNDFAHPASFPEDLARDHIISWSNPNDVVLDPMCGSGTTLKAAKELGRQFLGFDISQNYVDMSKRRIESAKTPMLVPGQETVVEVAQLKFS